MLMMAIATEGCSADKSTPVVLTVTGSIREPALGDNSVRQADDMVLVYVPAGVLSMGSNEPSLDTPANYATSTLIPMENAIQKHSNSRIHSGLIYPWGDEFDCQKGNFWEDSTPCEDGFSGPAPVGSFASGASWAGALDMAGNVWELVSDEYGASSLFYALRVNVNIPSEPRVLRGGS